MKRDIIACLLLIALVLTFLNRGVRMQGVFFGADEIGSDLLHFSYPYREFWANDYLKNGKVTLWNPYIGSGVPILAEAQTGVYFPISIVLYYFFSAPVAFNYLIIICFAIIAVTTYIYARRIGLSSLSAFFTASIFTLSGFMWGHLRHVPIITAITTMPLMFLAVEEIVRGGKVGWMLTLAILTAFSFFAGHYTTTYLILFILSIYFLLRMRGSENVKLPFYVFGAFILSGLIAAVQLLPSLELVRYSTRLNIEILRAVSAGSNYYWRYLALFLNPYIFGDPSRATWDMDKANYWENIGYFGLIPLAFSIVFLFSKIWKEKESVSVLKISFVLSFFLTLGFLTPLYNFFSEAVPGFSMTRISGRFLVFVDFFGAVLSGFILERLKKPIAVGIVIVSIAELFYFGYPFNTVMPLKYLSEPSSASFIKTRDTGLFRINSVALPSWATSWQKARGWRGDLQPYIDQREVIPPDLNVLYRLSSPSIIYELVGHFSVKRPGEIDSYSLQLFNDGVGKDYLAKIWGIENVKYVINSVPINDVLGLKLIKKTDNAYIYENGMNLPRAYFVGSARGFTNGTEVLKTILRGDFEPKKEVLVEGVDNKLLGEGSGEVKIDEYKDTKVVISASVKKEGYLVLSDTFYPGWRAYIDGAETKIYQANYAYRAIRVGAGSHQVVFEYKPKFFEIGKYISIISLAAVFLGMTALLFRKK